MNSTAHLFGQLHDEIRKADRILLVSDAKPDGDSIGSTTAALTWLLREGKNVCAFSIEPVPPTLRFLDNAHCITSDVTIFEQPFDLVITFDASDPKRSGITEHHPKIPTKPPVAVFDHHHTNPRYGDINIVHTDASSTCEVVYNFFVANDIHIDANIATSLLTGITYDTTSFTNAATNPKAVDAYGKLLAAGARVSEIHKNLLHNKSIPALKLWGTLLSRLQYNPKYDVVSTYLLLTDAPDTSSDVIEGVSNFLNAVTTGADTILFLREIPGNKVRGSLRSVNRDISKVAKLLGGGGHKKASGFTVDGHIEMTSEGPKIV